MIEGRVSDVGVHFSFSMCIVLSGLDTVSLTTTEPGVELEKVKWCMVVMPFKAVCRNGLSKKAAQSYVGTKTVPSCVPTS